MDFTLKQYRALLTSLIKAGYTFLPLCEYLKQSPTDSNRNMTENRIVK